MIEFNGILKDTRHGTYISRRYQITPLEVIFEDLVGDRDTTLKQICAFLEVPLRLDMLEEKLISTHTKVNDKWYDRVLGGYAKYL